MEDKLNNFNHIINNIPQGYIAKSNIHGYGLFASNNILKDTNLVELDGQLVNWIKYN